MDGNLTITQDDLIKFLTSLKDFALIADINILWFIINSYTGEINMIEDSFIANHYY